MIAIRIRLQVERHLRGMGDVAQLRRVGLAIHEDRVALAEERDDRRLRATIRRDGREPRDDIGFEVLTRPLTRAARPWSVVSQRLDQGAIASGRGIHPT